MKLGPLNSMKLFKLLLEIKEELVELRKLLAKPTKKEK